MVRKKEAGSKEIGVRRKELKHLSRSPGYFDFGMRIADCGTNHQADGSLQQAGGIVIAAVYYETLFLKSEMGRDYRYGI